MHKNHDLKTEHNVKRVFVIGASSGINVGDNLFFESVLRDINKEYSNVQFTIPAINPEWFTRNLANYSIDIIPIGRKELTRKPFRTLYHAVKSLKRSNVVILTAGMYYDWKLFNLRENTVFIFLFFVIIVRALKTPVGAYCAGVGPIYTNLGRWIIRSIFNSLSFIILRDEQSKSLLQEIGVTKPPTYVTVDPVISISSVDKKISKSLFISESIPAHTSLVGLNINYLIDSMIKPINRMSEAKFVETLASAIDSIIDNYSVEMVLITLCSKDVNITEKIRHNIKHTNNVHSMSLFKDYDSSTIAGVFSCLDAMIGMRLHSVIIASAMYVPTMAVSYAPKVKSYMEMLGQKKYVLDVNDLNINNICSMFNDLWISKQHIGKELEAMIAELRLRNNSARIALSYSRD